MSSPELQFTNPGLLPEQEMNIQEARHELGVRVRRALEFVIQDIESYYLDEVAAAHASTEPITTERIAASLDWLQNLAEGHDSIPEYADEHEITRICDTLKDLFEAYVALKEQAPVPEDIRKMYEVPPHTFRYIRTLSQLLDEPDYTTPLALKVIASAIGDIDTDASVELREQLLDLGLDPVDLASARLPKTNTPAAVRLVKRLAAEKVDFLLLLQSLCKADFPEAYSLLKQALNEGIPPNEILSQLSAVNTPIADRLRRELASLPDSDEHIIESLYNTSSHASIEPRKDLLKRGWDVSQILGTLSHVLTPEAEALRRSLIPSTAARGVLMSLCGVDDPESMEIRQSYWEADAANLDDDVVLSLYDLTSPESMQFRKFILNTRDESFTKSIALSLQGVDTPESMEIRELLDDDARLTSLKDVSSPESILMRTEILKRAIHRDDVQTCLKILISLIGIDTPGANTIRQTIADLPRFKPHIADLLKDMQGCGSNEAISIYRDLLWEEEISDYQALEALQGVGTPESISFRNTMLNRGRDSLRIARSLIGAYTDAAMDFREDAFGSDPDLYLESLANADDLR